MFDFFTISFCKTKGHRNGEFHIAIDNGLGTDRFLQLLHISRRRIQMRAVIHQQHFFSAPSCHESPPLHMLFDPRRNFRQRHITALMTVGIVYVLKMIHITDCYAKRCPILFEMFPASPEHFLSAPAVI